MTTDTTSSAQPEPEPAPEAKRAPRWRRFLVAFLVVVGCILTPVSIIAVWVHNTLLDTDQWVATVGPLVDDPDVQEAVANRVSNALIQDTDVEERIRELLPNRAQALAPVVAGGARQVVDAATLGSSSRTASRTSGTSSTAVRTHSWSRC